MRGHMFKSGSIINAATPYIIKECISIFGKGNVYESHGYETAETRAKYGVSKDHKADAWCATVAVLNITPKEIPTDFTGYSYNQYRRHNRAAQSYIHERTYKDANGKVVAKNRNKRCDQKYDSLAEYRATATEADISALKTTPAMVAYRSYAGLKPGTLVRVNGIVKQVRKTTSQGIRIFFANEDAGTNIKMCEVLVAPGGLVCS